MGMDHAKIASKALATAATYAGSDRHGTAWAHLARAERQVEAGRRQVVAGLRADGRSWGEIAVLLRVSKSTLLRRWGTAGDDQAAVDAAALVERELAALSMPSQRVGETDEQAEARRQRRSELAIAAGFR
jgi:hypothetical protein